MLFSQKCKFSSTVIATFELLPSSPSVNASGSEAKLMQTM